MELSHPFERSITGLVGCGLLVIGSVCYGGDRPTAQEYFETMDALEKTFFPVFEVEYRSAREYLDTFVAEAKKYRIRADDVVPTTEIAETHYERLAAIEEVIRVIDAARTKFTENDPFEAAFAALGIPEVARVMELDCTIRAYADQEGVETVFCPPGPTLSATVSGSSVNLNWTEIDDTDASGYKVFRGSAPGGPYSEVAEVTPRTTTTYTDTPGSGTFHYVVRAFFQNWESGDGTEASVTIP